MERLFKETTLSFCIGIKNILYTNMVPFLVQEIFKRLQLGYTMNNHAARNQMPQDTSWHTQNLQLDVPSDDSEDEEEKREQSMMMGATGVTRKSLFETGG